MPQSSAHQEFEINTARSKVRVEADPSMQVMHVSSGSDDLSVYTSVKNGQIYVDLKDGEKTFFSGLFSQMILDLQTCQALRNIRSLISLDPLMPPDEQRQLDYQAIAFFLTQAP